MDLKVVQTCCVTLQAEPRESMRLSPPGWMTSRVMTSRDGPRVYRRHDTRTKSKPVLSCCCTVQAVLSESLRLSPPGWMTSRKALEDITLNGVFIPKGAVVYIDYHGIQRDERYWPEPNAFKPERFLDKVRPHIMYVLLSERSINPMQVAAYISCHGIQHDGRY